MITKKSESKRVRAPKKVTLISLHVTTDGMVEGELGGEFGTSREVAQGVLGIALPMVSSASWEKVAGGWAFKGVMRSFGLVLPAANQQRAMAAASPKP
jgi:hypothetical protein